MISTTITDDHVNRSLGFVQKVIDACGTRLPGSDGDIKAADMVYQEMTAFDESAREEFTFAPKAFLGFFDVFVGSFLVATLLLFLGGPWLYGAAAVLTVGVLAGISQFVFYWGWFDIFYRKKNGVNVVGVIHPEHEAEVKQEILICGHHDSAWVVNFLVKHQKLYAVRLILGVGVIVAAYLLTIVLAVLYARTGSDPFPSLANFAKYGSLLGFFFAVPLLFYRDRRAGTCGAGDNLISSSMALQIGRILQEAKNSGRPLLKQTRVRVISFDAEEAGRKGSKAYVRRHRCELLSIPAYALCPDCIYRIKHFRFLTNDQNGLLKTPPQIVNEVAAIAGELGYFPAIAPFPFGGGATDAASFLRIGVPALAIMGMDTALIRDGLVYHTPQDLVENIDRDVVEATMKIMLAYLVAKDKQVVAPYLEDS